MNNLHSLALLADFYELTMMQGYLFDYPDQHAVFEMFYRHQPFDGGYAIFAGLDPLLDEIEKLHFSGEDIDYLASLGRFRKEFLDYLAGFQFKGDIYAIREGTPVFPNEPLMRVHGSLIETQLIESLVLNFINFQSLIATKAARIADTAENGPVLEFGLRRAQGVDGALSASRASYIGGTAATSNTLAGKIYGIPVSGTMAHSWVMNAGNELEAFQKYAALYLKSCILLVDTFDTLQSGIPNAIAVFRELKKTNPALMGVRIDSGDLEYLSKKARGMLDSAGLSDVKIYASSDIDEHIIMQLRARKAPIDAWGIGTCLITGGNEPALSGVYKIVARQVNGSIKPCLKISNQTEKITNPGIKNIMRFYDENGLMIGDLVYLEEEHDELAAMIAKKEPIKFRHPTTEYSGFTMKNYARTGKLISCVIQNGKRTTPETPLVEIRNFACSNMKSLHETYRRLLNPHRYKVSLSSRLKDLKTEIIKSIINEF